MGGLIVSGVSFAYLVMCFVFARKAYRAEYRKIYGAPAPRCYGGKIGHDRAHELAIREGVEWLAMWPLYLGWALVYRLISGPVPAHVKLDEIQAEVDRLAEKQDPLKDLSIKHTGRSTGPGYGQRSSPSGPSRRSFVRRTPSG